MKTTAAFLLVLSVAADAATRIAVVELGLGGAVRRTSSKSSATTVEGVNSFFQAMHGTRKLQHANMPVVPDLFKKADAGVVVGLSGSGVDVESMPSIAALLTEESSVAGHLETGGAHCDAILAKTKNSQEVVGALPEAVEKAVGQESLSGVKMTINDSTMADSVDKDIGALIHEMDQKYKEASKTVVMYLVIEDDSAVSRRRLNDNAAEEQQGSYYFFEKKNQYDNQEGGNAGYQEENKYAKLFAGYYGYGYYNSYDEWVTPYKSMFQIQYFNVVLWTAIGLFLVLFSAIMMMMFMPLEPDTLLFGESAKMIGED